MIKIIRKLNWIIIILCLGITWLPYFNILNSAILIAKIPQPLFIIVASNIVLTICNIALYPLYYKPFFKKLKDTKNIDTLGGL